MQIATSTHPPELDIKIVEITSPSKQMRLVDARYLQALEELAQRVAQNFNMAGPCQKITTFSYGKTTEAEIRELLLRLTVLAP